MSLQLSEIFHHQHELAKKYNPLEVKLGFYAPERLPMPINTYMAQDRLRMFYAYICEEVAEVALAETPGDFAEELSDVLHFVAEFCLICGLPPESIEKLYLARSQLDMFDTDPNAPSLGEFQLLMGKAMNQLKYKRWKLSPRDTNLVKFYDAVMLAVVELLNYIKFNGLDPHTIYMSKHKKNEDRIATGY